MFRNVYIEGVGSYHPSIIVGNDYYVNHFKKYGMEEHAIGLMEKVGRERRTLADENETSITMSVEAAKKAIRHAKLESKDIDAIISVSDTPEYLTPCCALIIKNMLQADKATNVFDINNDCIGMLTGIDIAVRYLKTDKKYKRILVVGALNISPFARENDLVVYGCISDGAAAVVLQVKEEEEERGFLGSRMYTDDTYNDTIRFPVCGLSNIVNEDVDPEDRKMVWNPFDFSFLSEKWSELILGLLGEYDYKEEDVTHYFMSQFSKFDVGLTMENLGATKDQATFIGHKYGYTGCASPIMALDDRIKREEFEKDEISIFCSVAAGYTMAALLYKW
jgi:3-oxoacyl-[acyl-carrier-protein] synthase-3